MFASAFAVWLWRTSSVSAAWLRRGRSAFVSGFGADTVQPRTHPHQWRRNPTVAPAVRRQESLAGQL